MGHLELMACLEPVVMMMQELALFNPKLADKQQVRTRGSRLCHSSTNSAGFEPWPCPCLGLLLLSPA
jgi:hypothetical protein